jgi:hypothetical protein
VAHDVDLAVAGRLPGTPIGQVIAGLPATEPGRVVHGSPIGAGTVRESRTWRSEQRGHRRPRTGPSPTRSPRRPHGPGRTRSVWIGISVRYRPVQPRSGRKESRVSKLVSPSLRSSPSSTPTIPHSALHAGGRDLDHLGSIDGGLVPARRRLGGAPDRHVTAPTGMAADERLGKTIGATPTSSRSDGADDPPHVVGRSRGPTAKPRRRGSERARPDHRGRSPARASPSGDRRHSVATGLAITGPGPARRASAAGDSTASGISGGRAGDGPGPPRPGRPAGPPPQPRPRRADRHGPAPPSTCTR